MSQLYSLDSNIVIDILREKANVLEYLTNLAHPGDRFAICSVVYYEVMRGFKIANAYRRARQFDELYNSMLQLPLDEQAIQEAVRIYASLHRGQQIEDNDIYIAAIAIVNDCTLITANARHFSRIDDLSLLTWNG